MNNDLLQRRSITFEVVIIAFRCTAGMSGNSLPLCLSSIIPAGQNSAHRFHFRHREVREQIAVSSSPLMFEVLFPDKRQTLPKARGSKNSKARLPVAAVTRPQQCAVVQRQRSCARKPMTQSTAAVGGRPPGRSSCDEVGHLQMVNDPTTRDVQVTLPLGLSSLASRAVKKKRTADDEGTAHVSSALGTSSPHLKTGHVLNPRRVCEPSDAVREAPLSQGGGSRHGAASRSPQVAPQSPCVLPSPPISTLGCPRSRPHSRLPPTTRPHGMRNCSRSIATDTVASDGEIEKTAHRHEIEARSETRFNGPARWHQKLAVACMQPATWASMT